MGAFHYDKVLPPQTCFENTVDCGPLLINTNRNVKALLKYHLQIATAMYLADNTQLHQWPYDFPRKNNLTVIMLYHKPRIAMGLQYMYVPI